MLLNQQRVKGDTTNSGDGICQHIACRDIFFIIVQKKNTNKCKWQRQKKKSLPLSVSISISLSLSFSLPFFLVIKWPKANQSVAFDLVYLNDDAMSDVSHLSRSLTKNVWLGLEVVQSLLYLGSNKELLEREILQCSYRRNEKFIAIEKLVSRMCFYLLFFALCIDKLQ